MVWSESACWKKVKSKSASTTYYNMFDGKHTTHTRSSNLSVMSIEQDRLRHMHFYIAERLNARTQILECQTPGTRTSFAKSGTCIQKGALSRYPEPDFSSQDQVCASGIHTSVVTGVFEGICSSHSAAKLSLSNPLQLFSLRLTTVQHPCAHNFLMAMSAETVSVCFLPPARSQIEYHCIPRSWPRQMTPLHQ